MTHILTAVLIVIGAIFVFVGSLGLLRLPDFYTRLHAPTKATTLGLASLLAAASVYSATSGALNTREFLITFFLFITAPISAHMLARGAIRRRLHSRAPVPDDMHRDHDA